MRTAVAALIAAGSLTSLATVQAGAAPEAAPKATCNQNMELRQLVDCVLFQTTMDQFLNYAGGKSFEDKGLIWKTNLCTGVPSDGSYYNFSNACRRHDFGYWNYPTRLRDQSESTRKRVDDRFLADMKDSCTTSNNKPKCLDRAERYYSGVRQLGSLFFKPVRNPREINAANSPTARTLQEAYRQGRL
ncbi:phospholipase A2 [Longimycelium tulufanense]|nr:phospholipase A2 [Longimycelium tulufanense]